MSFFEDVPSLSPVQFFGLTADCLFSKGALKPEKRFLLPSTAELLGEEPFAEVYASWHPERLSFHINVSVPFQKSGDGDFRKGDSVELFIDTRDLKSKGVISRFCSCYTFSAVPWQNFCGREVTRFRNDDMHCLCHPEDLQVTPKFYSDSYSLTIEIPAQALHGFDPIGFPRLGFTYIINRTDGPPQHFAVSSDEYAVEQHPATWGTLRLIKDEE